MFWEFVESTESGSRKAQLMGNAWINLTLHPLCTRAELVWICTQIHFLWL